MTLRENLTERQRWAHAVLDDVRDGGPVQSLSGGIAAAIEAPKVAA